MLFREQNLFLEKLPINFSKFIINLVFPTKILYLIFTIIFINFHFLIPYFSIIVRKFLTNWLEHVLNELNLKLKIIIDPFAKK